jgi:S-(hydroxymethyl)glutathione dehydrogenase/alcohol dehydrogenase
MQGAVLRQVGDSALSVVDDLEVTSTGSGQVRVKIQATGVCHTDLSAMEGIIHTGVPAVLGHEGAGIVAEVGEDVNNVAVGDHVVVAWVPPCGNCSYCLGGQPHLCSEIMMLASMEPRFVLNGEPVFGLAGCGTFAEEIVLPAQSVVKIPDDVPFDVASLLGCGVMTGVGAAINTAKVTPGSSVVVFGVGGIGVSVIQGAKIAGAAEIVAVDPVESKWEQAVRFGATHTCAPDGLDALKAELTTGQGFDFAFEAVGIPTTIRATYDAARRGGTAVIVGAGRSDQTIELNAFELFYMEKRLVGSFYGSANVRLDFNRLLRLWRTGRLDLEGMITQKISLKDVNRAFDDMKAGKVIRTVLEVG